ncbi:DUF222 domain-containing protein [Nostocoides japonicum]|uniref:DUF222 domain-containing protein n=1 Tax=Nostocoides japonicum TaxID=99481 RepID=UPI00191017F8
MARSVGSQVALARRESPVKGDRLVGLARALVTELPRTLAALERGETNEWRATLVVRETAILEPGVRAVADARLAADLPSLGDRGVERAARRLAEELDAAAVVARRARAVASRRVTCRPAPDGMAYLSVLGPLVEVVGAYAALTRHARVVTTGGPQEADADGRVDEADGRSLGQVMADTALRWLSGRGLGQAQPVEVNLVMTDVSLFGDTDRDGEESRPGPARARPDDPGSGGRAGPDRPAGGPCTRDDGDLGGGAAASHAGRTARSGGAGSPPTSPTAGGSSVPGATSAQGGSATTAPSSSTPLHQPARPTPPAPSDAPSAADSSVSPPRGSSTDQEDAAGDAEDPGTPTSTQTPRHGPTVSARRGSRVSGIRDPDERAECPTGPAGRAGPRSPRRAEEPARIPGHGSLPAAVARAVIRGEELPARRCGCAGDQDESGVEAARVWVRRLYTAPEGRDLVAMDSHRRVFTGQLRRLLVLRDDVCRTPWCDAPIRDADHVVAHAAGGPTSVANGAGLCRRCNLTKEQPGWDARVTSPGPRQATAAPAPTAPGVTDLPVPGVADLPVPEAPAPPAPEVTDPPEPAGPHTIRVTTPTGHAYSSMAPPVLGWGFHPVSDPHDDYSDAWAPEADPSRPGPTEPAADTSKPSAHPARHGLDPGATHPDDLGLTA